MALELADLLRAEGEDPVAVSCDSLQVYEGLGRLTGAVSAAENERLEHRLVGFVPVTEDFSVGDYMPLAHAEIDAALDVGRRPIVLGGTGLYLRAALAKLSLERVEPGDESELWSPQTRRPTAIFGLTMKREDLYARIDSMNSPRSWAVTQPAPNITSVRVRPLTWGTPQRSRRIVRPLRGRTVVPPRGRLNRAGLK